MSRVVSVPVRTAPEVRPHYISGVRRLDLGFMAIAVRLLHEAWIREEHNLFLHRRGAKKRTAERLFSRYGVALDEYQEALAVSRQSAAL